MLMKDNKIRIYSSINKTKSHDIYDSHMVYVQIYVSISE